MKGNEAGSTRGEPQQPLQLGGRGALTTTPTLEKPMRMKVKAVKLGILAAAAPELMHAPPAALQSVRPFLTGIFTLITYQQVGRSLTASERWCMCV